MVAARFIGADMDGEMAVWAVSGSVSDLLRMSGIFAADGFAKEFSIWGVDSPRSEELNVTTHGVKEAKACVEAVTPGLNPDGPGSADGAPVRGANPGA